LKIHCKKRKLKRKEVSK